MKSYNKENDYTLMLFFILISLMLSQDKTKEE